MGFSPADVGAMSFWQFQAALDGWKRANGATEELPLMSDDEFDAAASLVD